MQKRKPPRVGVRFEFMFKTRNPHNRVQLKTSFIGHAPGQVRFTGLIQIAGLGSHSERMRGVGEEVGVGKQTSVPSRVSYAPFDLGGFLRYCWLRRKLPFPGAALSTILQSLLLGWPSPTGLGHLNY